MNPAKRHVVENVLSRMPFLKDTLMGVYKVVFTGPSGVGKTTMIHCLDPNATSTEVSRFLYGFEDDAMESVRRMAVEATTTIDFDFTALLVVRTAEGSYDFLINTAITPEKLAELHVEKSWFLHLFGVPGQERFKPLREWVEQGADGVLLLIDSTDLKFLTVIADYYTDIVQRIGQEVPVIICANKQDLPDAIDPIELQNWLGEGYLVIPTVATQCYNVKKALLELLVNMI